MFMRILVDIYIFQFLMDLLLRRLIGVSLHTELLITTLLNLVACAIVTNPYNLSENLNKIWNLPVAKGNPDVTEDFIYWIKFLLSTITRVRSYTAYIYFIFLILMLDPILTWRRPILLMPWMILQVIGKILMDSLAILIGLLLCWVEKCSYKNLFEFLIVQATSLILLMRNWLSVKKLYVRLTQYQQILARARAQRNRIHNYEESILSLDERQKVCSLLNIHELKLPLHSLENQKLTKSLTTVLTTDSQNSEEIDKASSITYPDIDLSPAQKFMKIFGITDEDIMNVKINGNRKVSTASSDLISAGNQIPVKEVQCLCTTETCSGEEKKHSEKSKKLKKEERSIYCDKITLRNDPVRQDFFDDGEFPSKWSSEEDLDEQKILQNFLEPYVNMIEQENCSTFYPADEKVSEKVILQEKRSYIEEGRGALGMVTELLTEPEPVISVALNDNQNNSTKCTNLKNIIRQLSNENWAMKIGLRNQLSSRFNEQHLMLSNALSKKNIKSWLEYPVECQIENFNKLPQNGSNSVLKYSKKCNYSQTSWKPEGISKHVGTENSKRKKDMQINVMVSNSKKQNHQFKVIPIKIAKAKDHQEVIDESIDWGTVTLAQSARPSGYERMKSKLPVYPKKDKMSFHNNDTEPTISSINRNSSKTQDRNRIRKRSKDRDSMRSSRISRISESLEEREAREIKALRAYNEKTLVKDKLKMESKKRDKSLRDIGVIVPEDLKDPSNFPMRNISINYDPLEKVYHPKSQDVLVKKLKLSGKDASSILEFLDTYNVMQLREELEKIKDFDIPERKECNILETKKIKNSLSYNSLSKDLQRKVSERTTTREYFSANIETSSFKEVNCQENMSISVINERTSQDHLNSQNKRNSIKITEKSESFKEVIKNINWISFTKNQIKSTIGPMENLQDNHWQDRNEYEILKFDDTLHWLMRVMYFTNQDVTSTLKSLDYNRKFLNVEILMKDLKEWNFVGVPNEFVSQPSAEIDLSLDDSAIPCGFKISELNILEEEPCMNAGISLEDSSEIQSHTKPNIEDNCFNVFNNSMDFNDTNKIRDSIYVPQHFFLFESFIKNVTLPTKNFEKIQNSENTKSLSKLSSSHSYSLDSNVPSNSSNQTISLGNQSMMEEFSSDSFDRHGATDT